MKLIHLLLIAAALLFLSSCGREENTAPPFTMPPVDVATLTVLPASIPVTFEYVGLVQSFHKVEIRSRVEGFLTKIAYREGQLVEEGDLLFLIDPKPFEAALDNAKGDLAVHGNDHEE